MKQRRHFGSIGQFGLTLVELMVSIAIGMTVLSGVVQVLVVSKSNFVTERELAALQENARFALRFLTDEIRMAGYTGCAATPANIANSVIGSNNNWYLNTGLMGYEYDAGIATFPDEFEADVAVDTDVIVVRRGEMTPLRVAGHNGPSATISFTATHSYKPGQVMVLAKPDCTQVGIFQMTNPTNSGNNASTMVHNQGAGSPGNCEKGLVGNYSCANSPGNATQQSYGIGARIMELHSSAYYVGVSETDNTVPALYRERLQFALGGPFTAAEELVQGIENMQILYGYDSNVPTDGQANRYYTADLVPDWEGVVTVRLSLRMRSIFPVYNLNVDFGEFMGVDATDGSDRFMRQIVTTTIQIRNS